MTATTKLAPLAAVFMTLLIPAVASAQGAQPTGVWIDHTGRGAVEITECGGGLCGHVVWVKDAKHIKTCRNQVLGNVRPVGGGTWDKGWIIDPDDNARYSVELKPIGTDRLRVVGYMGSKMFSETMTWKRAPDDLKRCDGKEAVTPVVAPAPVPSAAPSSPTPTETYTAPPEPAPQRQATAPVPPAPAPVVPSSRLPTTEPSAIEPSPVTSPPVTSPRVTTIDPPEAPPRRQASAKGKSKDCKVDLGYVTLKYPCDAF